MPQQDESPANRGREKPGESEKNCDSDSDKNVTERNEDDETQFEKSSDDEDHSKNDSEDEDIENNSEENGKSRSTSSASSRSSVSSQEENIKEEQDKKAEVNETQEIHADKAANDLSYEEKVKKALMGDMDFNYPEKVKIVRIFTSSTFTGTLWGLSFAFSKVMIDC